MKNKNILLILALICVLCCAFALAACDTDKIVEVTGITLDITRITLTEGENITLTATITPSDATDQAMDWTSSNPSVATVNSASVVAVSAGEATITVTTANGKTATCVVKVVTPLQDDTPTQYYTVTFLVSGKAYDGDAVLFDAQVADGENLSEYTVTRGDEYVFLGWFKDANLTQKWDTDNDVVNGDMKLYAGWRYLSPYQSVVDALAARVQDERNDDNLQVEVLLIFEQDGRLCFVEKDRTGVFSYKTDVTDFENVLDNDELLEQIPTANLTQLNAYNYANTSDNNAVIADSMAYRYSIAANPNEAIIYSCVSEWEDDGNKHFTTVGPWYSCKVKAIVADKYGRIYDCSFTVVAPIDNFGMVIGGNPMSKDFDVEFTPLGELAEDFYRERLKELEA